MPKRKKGLFHSLLKNRALCEHPQTSKRRRVYVNHEVEEPPPDEDHRHTFLSPSQVNYDGDPPCLQKNAISAFMEYGQRIGKQPKLDCQAKFKGLFRPGNPTFIANARIGSELICQAEGSNKKEAKTKAADRALRTVSTGSTVTQASRDTGMMSAVPGKDPVSALMEHAQSLGLTATIEESSKTGPSHCPTFRLYAKLGDRDFQIIEHGNKKNGRKKAANIALLQLQSEGKMPKPQQRSTERIICSTRSQNFSDICPPGKNPLQIFYEYAQLRHLTCDVIEASPRIGPPHNLTFSMAARLGKQQFKIVTGKNKNETKKRATVEALRQLKKLGKYELTQNATEEFPLSMKTWNDRIAVKTLEKFRSLEATVNEDLSGRKVLAAILLYDRNKDELSVVSLGTGNRCVTGDNLCDEGNVINDSHAEIIAKRGFQRYLLSEIFCSRSSRILTRTLSGTLRVMPHLSFHLYISTAPCGDGAVFTRADTGNTGNTVEEHTPIFGNRRHGLLRTKVEKGEGTIPTDDVPQTMDGIRRGQRLRTMSCSDKICRWNVLGLQGALLSLYLEPIYLSSITLGMLFSDGHMSRAMCCRVDRGGKPLTELPLRYTVKHPDLGCVTRVPDTRTVDRSSSLSVNWNKADNSVELTDGTNGMTTRHTASRLCKRSKFLSFSRINNWRDLSPVTYREKKDLATEYTIAKAVFELAMYEKGCGQWVRKPPEVDLFYYKQSPPTNVKRHA